MSRKEIQGVYNDIEDGESIFLAAVQESLHCLEKNELEMSAIMLQIAADYAAGKYIGFYYSFELENTAKCIAKKMNVLCTIQQPKPINRVLHVISQVYEVGGHTRLLENWLQYDKNSCRSNSLVVTNQGIRQIAAVQLSNIKKNIKNLYFLIDRGKSISARVKYLEEISKNFDVIVLHSHPEDVIPLLCYSNSNIPILFVNHADHRFWVGRSISNLILEIRESGSILSNTKRNVKIENQRILPIPLQQPIYLSKEQVREKLLLQRDDIVIFSVASAHKYIPITNYGIGNLLLEIVNYREDIKVIVIGPNDKNPYWRNLKTLSNGRINAIGIKPQIDEYYIASDIYLDSYPISSLTSLLDAAKYGLPVLSLNTGMKTSDIDDIALNNLDFCFSNHEELLARMRYLVDNVTERAIYGTECQKEIENFHIGSGWLMLLEKIYKEVGTIRKIQNEENSVINTDNSEFLLTNVNKGKHKEMFYYNRSYIASYYLFPFRRKITCLPGVVLRIINNPSLIKGLVPNTIKVKIRKRMQMR